MSFEFFHIAVWNAHLATGAELSRLAIALGHEVTGIVPSGEVPGAYVGEPWTQGVTWRCVEALQEVIEQCDRLVICATSGLVETPLFQSVFTTHAHDVVVIASHEDASRVRRDALVTGGERPARRVWMTPSSNIWMPGYEGLSSHTEDEKPAQRVERVAMAGLRAILEDERHGVIEADEIDHLGDAMMIQ